MASDSPSASPPPADGNRRTSAAALIIGNELLSGKVTDENTPFLVAMLRQEGVCLRRVVILPDDIETIAAELRTCAAAHDYVFTSGGVGPTHDDITMVAVARAFDTEVVRHPEIEALVHHYFGARVNDAALKLAEIPRGAALVVSPDSMLPVVRYENVYILPGIPKLFRAKLEALRPQLRGVRCHSAAVFITLDESAVAAEISEVAETHAGVEVGSYPRYGDSDYAVMITVDGQDPGEVTRAIDRLLELLPESGVLRVQR